ncbi:unnamed protein product, partial [Leptidea sinapis]
MRLAIRLGGGFMDSNKIYLPDYLPTSLYVEFLNKCQNIMTRHPNHKICIIGNFNLGSMMWSNQTGLPLSHLTLSKQINYIPNHLNRILDLAIMDSSDTISLSHTIAVCRLDSHHPPFELTLLSGRAPLLELCNSITEKLCFHKTRRPFDWEQSALQLDCDEFVHCFYNTLYEIIEKYTPKTKVRKKSYPVWFSTGLVKLLKYKFKFHVKFKSYGNPRYYDTFAMLRCRAKVDFDQCFRTCINRIGSDLATNLKAFWRYTKNKKVTNAYPRQMSYNNRYANDGPGIVNLFTHHFSSVYSMNANSN